MFTCMLRSLVQPDVISFSSSISACETGHQWEKALDLFTVMQRSLVFKPDVISFISSITACEKGQQWERAFELLLALQRHLFGQMYHAKL